jgi:hypothetical protein
MFEKLKSVLSRLLGRDREREDSTDDRDAGIPVPVRRGSRDRGSAVAVAEPDDDERVNPTEFDKGRSWQREPRAASDKRRSDACD